MVGSPCHGAARRRRPASGRRRGRDLCICRRVTGGGRRPLLCGRGSAFRLMSGLREQDMEFDRIVGAIEDVLMDPSFVQLQSGFCDAHCSKTPNPELSLFGRQQSGLRSFRGYGREQANLYGALQSVHHVHRYVGRHGFHVTCPLDLNSLRRLLRYREFP